MQNDSPRAIPNHEIVELVRLKAENLFEAHRLCCSESLLLVLNHGFNGGLTTEQAKQLGAGFCGGMGEAGSTCGALSGAIMALGLLLGPHAQNGMSKKNFRPAARKMHDQFQEHFASTCCRVLIEPYDRDKKGRAKFCRRLTGTAAALAAELLLEAGPDLAQRLQADYLTKQDSRISDFFKNLV